MLGEDCAKVADPLDYIRQWHERLQKAGWWHSFELPDGSMIQGVSDLASLKRRIAQFPIPADLTGRRVLDIGAWDGWFSFEMERRGAEVLAIDRFDNPRFHEIRERLGSRVEYRTLDVYDVSPQTLGRFDIVLFMGVLYHLKHPLLALERVCSVTQEMAAVESFVLAEHHGLPRDLEDRNLLQFFETDDFGGQVDNWFAPNTGCLMALCRTAGFARVLLQNRQEYGAAVACYRKWADLPDAAAPPQLHFAVHAENYGINFDSTKDEYVTCSATSASPMTRENTFPEVGAFGIRPVVARDGLVHFKLPPGLEPGWHEVRLNGSNAHKIAVDMRCAAGNLEIKGVRDGVTWQDNRITSDFLSAWVQGLPENADVANVRLHIDDHRHRIMFVGPDTNGLRQINVRIPEIAPGTHSISIHFGATISPPVDAVFIPKPK